MQCRGIWLSDWMYKWGCPKDGEVEEGKRLNSVYDEVEKPPMSEKTPGHWGLGLLGLRE